MKNLFFGKNLKYLRNQHELKQAEILEKIGFERTTWSGYENEKSFPKLEDFIKIADFFDINEYDLLHTDLEAVAEGSVLRDAESSYKTTKNLIQTLHTAVKELQSAHILLQQHSAALKAEVKRLKAKPSGQSKK